MERTRGRLEIELVGEFKELVFEGLKLDVYMFDDTSIGLFQVGVYKDIKVNLNEVIRARAFVLIKQQYSELKEKNYYNPHIIVKEPYKVIETIKNKLKEENTQ